MRNTDEEIGYWNYWARMPSLAIIFLCLVGSLSAFGQWTTSLGVFTNQSNFTFSNNGTDLGSNTQMIYLPDGANHSSLRFAYVNGSSFNQLIHCSKPAVTGSGWVAVDIPQIQSGTNTTTIVAVWNTSESFISNISLCGAGSPFTTSIPIPADVNFDSTVIEQDNPTFLKLLLAGGGGSARSLATSANMLSIITVEKLTADVSAGRPSACWGNPSAGTYSCMVFGTVNATFTADWGTPTGGNITTPAINQPVTLLLDMNTTQAMGRLLYPNGTMSAWLNATGSVPTSNGSIASFGIDFDQQLRVHFVGAAYGYGLRNITYLNTTGGAAATPITVSLSSPANLATFASGIGSVPISFNCSGNSNLDYLVNLTVNGDVNGTAISAPNNATSNWTINSSIDGTFVWSVLCYNSTTSANSTTRIFYISNNAPNISALNISTAAYQLGPVSANVTAQDAENYSLTILYTWYKNGVNTSSGGVAVLNNTMTTINAALSPYTVGDKWDILVVASDGANASAGNTSANTTILNYFSSVVFANETLYGGINSGAYLNFTLAEAASASAYFFIGTSNVSMTNSGVAPNYQFFANSIPPYVLAPTNYTAYWYFKATLANGSTYEVFNSSSNIVNISGLYLCNTSLITNSINYSFLDATTFLPVNTSMTSVYTWTSDDLATRVNTISNASQTNAICVSPPTFNKSTTALESMTALGYTPKVLSQPAQYYSNNSFNRVIYMVNSSYTANVVISVKNPAGAAFPSYTVLLYKYFFLTTSYNLTNSGMTDSTGQTVQSIELFPTVYQVVVLDDTGVIVKNITNPDVPFCSGLNYGQSCIYNIIIGSANPDYYGSIQSTFDGGGLCNFDNSTMYLTCNYNGSGSSSSFILKYLNVTLINGSWQQANLVNSNQSVYNGTSLTLKVAVPNASATYFYQFFAIYQGASTNTTALTGYDVLDSGTITIRSTPQFDPGRDVAIVLVMLVIVVALLLNQSPTIMILATGGVITFAAIIGLIVVSPLLIGVLVIMTVILADWVKGV